MFTKFRFFYSPTKSAIMVSTVKLSDTKLCKTVQMCVINRLNASNEAAG